MTILPSSEPSPLTPLRSSRMLTNSASQPPGKRVTLPALRLQEMEPRHRGRKLLSQGHAIHLQQSVQNLALPWLISPCPPSRAHLQPVMGSSWLCPLHPRAGFKFKVQDSQCGQPGGLSWRAELSPELPRWHGHTQCSCLRLKRAAVE